MFCFKFKIHALSNSRVAVLETTFFVHGNCCQLIQCTFPIFFSVKLETYSAVAKLITDHWSDVNNFVSYSSVFVSSTQQNIVLPCKLWIPESKLLALFKPLWITFFTKIPTLCSFTHSKTSCSKKTTLTGAGCHIVLTCNQAQNACDWGLHIKVRREQEEPELKPKLGASQPE